jgi:CRP/FNR family cyclic AMP-dependent transcriptional regulator
VVSKQGKERVVGLLEPGTFVVEACLAGQPFYLASARAATEATLVRVEVATMLQAIHDHPKLSQRFMAFLLLRNSQIEADLVDQLFNLSEKRLARLLIMLAQVGQKAHLRTVPAPISQEVMAARVGTTRPRINYFCRQGCYSPPAGIASDEQHDLATAATPLSGERLRVCAGGRAAGRPTGLM